jgi:hypothetical protein
MVDILGYTVNCNTANWIVPQVDDMYPECTYDPAHSHVHQPHPSTMSWQSFCQKVPLEGLCIACNRMSNKAPAFNIILSSQLGQASCCNQTDCAKIIVVV